MRDFEWMTKSIPSRSAAWKIRKRWTRPGLPVQQSSAGLWTRLARMAGGRSGLNPDNLEGSSIAVVEARVRRATESGSHDRHAEIRETFLEFIVC